MGSVIVLGGCGAVGGNAVRTLVESAVFDRVVIGDINRSRGLELERELGVSYRAFDVAERASIREAVSGCDVVLNCVGPFYKTVVPILETVIDAGIDYVDICDDVDATLSILELDGRARERGVKALIGMGSSPGATNVLARFAYDNLLDETDSIDIFHTHGGEPFEGAGVIGHRFHCMSIDVPMFLDGELRYVGYFEPEGVALRESFEFPVVGECPLYPYPHPEQVTMPRHMDVRRVTNKGGVLPDEYYALTRDLCGLGLGSREPVRVNGLEVAPYDFAVAYILKRREEILKRCNFGSQKGCCSVIVKGRKDDKELEYRFHMASSSAALGEGTGIPAAMGAILMHEGRIGRAGVMPPEACVDPNDLLELTSRISIGGKGTSKSAIIVECIDEEGVKTTLDI